MCAVEVVTRASTTGDILGQRQVVYVQIECAVEKLAGEVISICSHRSDVAPLVTVNDPALVVGRQFGTANTQAPTGEKLEGVVQPAQVRQLNMHGADHRLADPDRRIILISLT